jgi:hypothetical protein
VVPKFCPSLVSVAEGLSKPVTPALPKTTANGPAMPLHWASPIEDDEKIRTAVHNGRLNPGSQSLNSS